MDWLQALILGVIQGLAEYLPISSSGHLEIFHQLLGMETSGAESLQFDVVLHVATVLSTIVVLWHEFSGLCVSFFTFKRDANTALVWKILLSCIPVLLVGVLLKDQVDSLFGGRLEIVGTCLLVTAVLLTFAYYFGSKPVSKLAKTPGATKEGRDITYMDAFIIGCAQAVAVLPGLSRSGTTIATGLLLGDKRDKVASFSFLMVIIPVLGAALLDVLKGLSGSETVDSSIGLVPCLVGFVAAFVVGCVACKWMLNMVRKGKLIWFALYCLVVGILCLASVC